MRLLEQLTEEALDYVLTGEPFPLDLMVKLEAAGIIIEEFRSALLAEYMYKGI